MADQQQRTLPQGRWTFLDVDGALTEEEISNWFATELGIQLEPERISFGDGRVRSDGVRRILISFEDEVFAYLLEWAINGQKLGRFVPRPITPHRKASQTRQ